MTPVQLSPLALKHVSVLTLQNKVYPVLALGVKTTETQEDVVVEVDYTPAYVHPQVCRVKKLEAGQDMELPLPPAEYEHAKLMQLEEPETGTVSFTVKAGDETIHREEHPLHWHPHDTWVGGTRFPELLAALVRPNDPAIDLLLSRAEEELQSLGMTTGRNGYALPRSGIINRLHAIWNTVSHSGISYALPPESWMDDGLGQRVRLPSTILGKNCGTCLDTTLMLAALVAQAGFNPIVILVRGHAYMGVMLRDASLPTVVVREAATIRNLLQLEELLLMETTQLTGSATGKPVTFTETQATGRANIMKLADDDYFLALDIVRIWSTGIHPIAATYEELLEGNVLPQKKRAAAADDSFLPEESAASLEEAESLVEARPRSRMETWQLKLLDLSLRNNLLNTRMSSSRQIGLCIPDVARFEDKLSRNGAFRIKPIPETLTTKLARSESDTQPELLRNMQQELAEEMFSKNELLATDGKKAHSEDHLRRSLQSIYLAARHDMEESGSNTLYLACGFLKWYRRGDDAKPLLAPVLLIPVKLTRPSVKAGFTLRSADEETRINLTLLELLKTEFALRIPELEGDLPTDASGLDVPQIFTLLRRAIRELPGWEVTEDCSLGIFSFTKYLMWKDMVDRREALLKNPVVAHIASSERSTFPAQGDFPEPSTLDAEVDPRKVFTPLSSDSSQLSAVLAAARGKSFVLIGPPGTGKSQTIANMIAHCLGHGKTVLFVAEKSAALSVVHRRLKRIGLSEFCLELHSSKANKKDAIAQFRTAIDAATRPMPDTDWGNTVDTMATLRHTLNLLPHELHRPQSDGRSLYDDISLLAEEGDAPTFTPSTDAPLGMTATRREELCALAQKLALYYSPVADMLRGAAAAVCTTAYSFEWEEKLAEALQQMIDLRREAAVIYRELTAALGPEAADLPPEGAYALSGLFSGLCGRRSADYSCLCPPHASSSLARMEKIVSAAADYREQAAGLSLPYPESAPDDADLEIRYAGWKKAQLSNFIFRFFGVRKARKYLQVLAFSPNEPDCRNDFERLLAMKAARADILRNSSPEIEVLHRGTATTAEELTHARRLAGHAAHGSLPPALVQRLLSSPALQDSLRPQLDAWKRLDDAYSALEQEVSGLIRCPVEDLPQHGADWRGLLDQRPRWRELTLWNKVAEEARNAGADALAEQLRDEAVEPQQLETALRVNLARRRLRAAADSVAVLNEFTPHAHEDAIDRYAAQDASLLRLTTAHVRELLAKRAAGIAEYGREIAVLQREIAKQRAHIPLRKLLEAVPNAAALLKPCMLMSPLSVAQYLTPESAPFDVVIFDEASQIPVWDAIGALARGKNAIVVGDPRQMPPTSFFSRSKEDADDDSEVEHDMESILDECRACGIPELNLTWHYRSKAESLIAFSNHHYYDGKLTTFPAPVSTDTALQYHYVENGIYQRGAGKRINPEEARALVNHVLTTLRSPGFRYTEASSIGIVTFNMQQQRLIEDMLEEERAKDESLEPYFSESNSEAIFVKNLENVQGDERGVIYFSTTYGPDEQGLVSMNFGPLNLVGGERRLNVAITRARNGMHVFTSLKPESIDLNRTRARGAADFRSFLECARMGAGKFFSTRATDSTDTEQLARAVRRELEARGWNCTVNLGVSGYRVDIAVHHPDIPEAMLAGIVLDGPGYAGANTARDRDVLRGSVMNVLGWRLLRLWSLDWWRNPLGCMDAVDARLREWVTAGPPEPPELPSLLPDAEEKPGETALPSADTAPAEALPASPAPVGEEYREYTRELTHLSRIRDNTLANALLELVQMEGPVLQSRVISRIGKLSGTVMNASARSITTSKIEFLLRSGHLAATDEPTPDGETDRSLRLPDTPAARLRTRGTRDWTEIPASEFRLLAEQLRAHLCCLNGCEQHLRAIMAFYRITRMNKKFSDFILKILQQKQITT